MHHYTWQWSPTVLVLVILLGLFLVLSVALLLIPHFFNRRQRHTSRIIHTQYGDVDINRMSKRGLERARSRQYHIKGRE